MTAKKRNGTLWILLVLAVGVALLVWLLPDGEQRREARAVADTELAEPQPEVLPDATAESDPLDEAAQAAAATLVRAGDAAPISRCRFSTAAACGFRICAAKRCW